MAVGLFDSGVGGLSVLRQIRPILPDERLLYFADQAHVPYGLRPAAEIRLFSERISQFLMAQGADLIVVACNTATAAALEHLRTTFPDTPFVGMEPAVKPGAARTNSGKIGVLATAGTFESQRYASLLARYGDGIMAYESDCPGLVEQIEAGAFDSPETMRILKEAIRPMLAADVDTLILGCTHYPFVQSQIEQVAGPEVAIIDPAPAVAQQAKRVLDGMERENKGETAEPIQLFTSGDEAAFADQIRRLLGEALPVSFAQLEEGSIISRP